MMTEPSLDDWVWVLAMLNQAMLGIVSPNVRQICLCYENDWIISAILENHSDEDVDDLEDVAVETSIFIEDIKDRLSPCAYAKVSTSINFGSEPLQNPNTPNCRVVYRRKKIVLPQA